MVRVHGHESHIADFWNSTDAAARYQDKIQVSQKTTVHYLYETNTTAVTIASIDQAEFHLTKSIYDKIRISLSVNVITSPALPYF